MAFTAGELQNIANASLDYFLNKGDTFKQSIQARPLVAGMERGAKTFSGGKGDISLGVLGNFGDGSGNDQLKGYTHNDTVTFYTPANIQRAKYAWREMHIGLTLTHTELKHDGLSVADTNGDSTTSHRGRDMHVLVGLMENKLFDFGERYARSLNELLWGDGVADPKAMAGIQSILTEDPSTGTVGGLDRSVAGNSWWRNRARTAAFGTAVGVTPALSAHGGGAVTSAAANGGALIQVLQQEKRQLVRYGGNPTMFLAGSDFINAMEVEMRANGYYTQNGFRGPQDGAMGGLRFDGVEIKYDPTLDDMGMAKRAYWFDPRHIYLMKMDGEWRRQHTPSRPHDQFVLYRSITCTGQMVAVQCNSGLVIDIA